jgi:hypothetical protein
VAGVESALRPATAIERYGRIWRMGQWRHEDLKIAGRIGYERAGEVAELWDQTRQDFVERQLPEGLTSPYVLDPSTGLVVFQLRAGRIKPQSFAGAFRALLNDVTPEREWRVEYLIHGEPLWHWADRAARITRLEVRIERPNPNWGGRDDIQGFVEGHRAEVVKFILQAYKGDPRGLSLDEFLKDAIEQGLYKGSVKVGAEFETPVGTEQLEWRSDVQGAPQQTEVPLDPATGEASAEAMVDELDEYSDLEVTVELTEDADEDELA